MSEPVAKPDLVDTTDCLEAITAFRGMKNFLFIVSLLCLILLQMLFWAHHLGYVNTANLECPLVWNPEMPPPAASQAPDIDTQHSPLPQLAATVEVGDEQVSDEIAARADQVAEAVVSEPVYAETEPAESDQDQPQPEPGEKQQIPWSYIFYAVKLANFVLLLAVTLYSLLLLLSIKLSLVGRLGGLSHISKAFFFSLFALVLVLPWQNFFPQVIAGVIYTPDELFCIDWLGENPSFLNLARYFLRFVGLWIVELLLLIAAQARSSKWSATTLRRLGMK